MLFFSGKGVGLGSLASSQSVSFRQGTNVEFGSQSFNGSGGGPEPLEVAYSLDPVNTKNRDFHNPMYDAVQNNPEMIGNGSGGGNFHSYCKYKPLIDFFPALYEVPSEVAKVKSDSFTEPPSAVIAPSSVTHRYLLKTIFLK